MQQEIELKLVVLDNQHLTLFDHPTVLHYQQQDDPTTFDVLNTYYDSQQHDFLNIGMAVRIRDCQQKILQTIKGKGRVEKGLHARFEETAELKDHHLDLSLIQEKTLQETLTKIATEQTISPIFTTHFSRTQWILTLDQQTEIELVLDIGEVRSGSQGVPIYEIELELIKGNHAYALYQIAADLAHSIPLALQPRSKAWWGYKLHQTHQLGKGLTESIEYQAQPPAFFMEQADMLLNKA